VAVALFLVTAAMDLAHGNQSSAARSAMLAGVMVILVVTDGRPRYPWSALAWALIAATLVVAVYTWTSR
jgi:hypothetical protein